MFFLFNFLFLCSYISPTTSFPKPLNEKEERYYLELYKNGSKEAKDILIERNLRLVAHIVKKYQKSYNDVDDLISIGTIGLIKAISTFDISKGARLATYASTCIANATPTQRLKLTNMTPKVCLLTRNGIYSATSIAIG